MEFFPHTYDEEQTAAFIARMRNLYVEKGYCYFAVETLSSRQFIGFTGLAWQTYDAPFTPCVDIGWRLATKAWGRGYATEGARRCLDYAFNELQLKTVKAIAPVNNIRSIQVMEKIGMKPFCSFPHPLLTAYPRLADCVCYSTVRDAE